MVLKPLVAIAADYDRNMSSDLKTKLKGNLTAQASLDVIKATSKCVQYT